MDTAPIDERVLACARAAHEANRAYCIYLGDHSQKSWDEAESWQQGSAVAGVAGVMACNGPRESHESWLKNKREDGWVYGEVKDPEKRTHPCMVEYDDLPDDQKMKDEIFVSVVRAMMKALGINFAPKNPLDCLGTDE